MHLCLVRALYVTELYWYNRVSLILGYMSEYPEYTSEKFVGNKDYGKSVLVKKTCGNVSKLKEPKLRRLLY